MKHFRSEYVFKKHKPHVSLRKKILRFFRKNQYAVPSSQDSFHYKTNPFKVHKKTKKVNIKAIVFVVFLVTWAVCLAYLPYFRVNKVVYTGLNSTTQSELDEFVYGNFLNKKSFLPSNNYFFINTHKISNELYKNFALETVEVVKVFPNQLNINIKEKISSVIYDNGKKYFLLDSAGTVIKFLKDIEPYETVQKVASNSLAYTLSEVTTSTTSSTLVVVSSTEHTPDYKKIKKLFGNYPVVYDRRNFEVEIKQENVLPPEHIAAVIAWYKALAEQGIAEPKFFALENLSSGIVVDTNDAWDILFQPKNNSGAEVNTLKDILHTIKPQQYVDLRFGEKVYWK